MQLIVKYGELELLFHPVIQRLVKLKWDMYGRRFATFYLIVNIIYVMIWSAFAVVMSASRNPLEPTEGNSWRIILAVLGILMTVLALVKVRLLVVEDSWLLLVGLLQDV